MSERLRTYFHRRPHRRLIAAENETVTVNGGYESVRSINGGYESVRSITETVHSSEGEGSTEGSRSEISEDSVVRDSSYTRRDESNSTTETLETIESETENLLSERIVARAAHLEEVKDLVNANHSCVVEAFEDEAKAEWLIQETSPLYASQLVAQSRERTQSMLASKQTLEKFLIPRNMIPRVDDAVDNERQLVMTVSKTAKGAGEQQKQLREIEQRSYQAFFALIEKQHNERMQLSKRFQDEKESHLKQWAASRMNTLDFVQSIESNSQHLLETLNILVETMRKHETEGHRVRVETPTPSKSECQVCYDEIEGPSSGRMSASRTRGIKQRSCFIPCNHAMICLSCATEIWETTKSCPFCKVMLTTKPLALFF
ncbi:hypothetical protein KC19_3G228800 [Ceratodon purpureus]|uniref:RING-type domain-containing protein n=1 Tax=Ceratodon purpureus TaxID=3225 RepID=A0A8T0INY1_CERPU|nr:hypothetical protein KC19_3G228800 [Ceratodon purpureus]